MKKVLLAASFMLLTVILFACTGNTTTTTTTGTTSSTTTTTTTTAIPTDNDPVILGADDVTIEKNSTFIPLQGITATDVEDGDLTDEVTYQGNVNPNAVGVYTATYTVIDNDGNVTVVERTVTVVFTDVQAPLITGTANKTIYVGELFDSLAGVAATDTIDGTVDVTVEGSLNIWLPGVYTLTYSASDESDNVATVERTITVTFGDFVFGDLVDVPAASFTTVEDVLHSPAISGGVINENIAAFTFVKVILSASATTDGSIGIALGSARASLSEVALTSTVAEYTVYFVIDAALDAAELTIDQNGLVVENLSVQYAFAEVRDMIAPVLSVPNDEAAYAVGYTQEELEALLLAGVTAVDNIDGNITSSVSIDYGNLDLNVVGEYDVVYSVTDGGNNTSTYTRTVIVGNLVDAGYITDPTFENQGDGLWKEKSNDGQASISYDATLGEMNVTVTSLGNYMSAAGAYLKESSLDLEAGQWYMFTFTVKTTINRIMGFRMGLMSDQAHGWIDDYDGRNDHQYAITAEYQTFNVFFQLDTLTSTSGGNEFIIELNLGNLNYSNVGKDGVTTFKNVGLYKVVTEFLPPTYEENVGPNLPVKFTEGDLAPNWADYVTFKDMSNNVLTPVIDASAVNMAVAGSYDVTYTATDSYDHSTVYTLTIQVLTAATADTVGPVITPKEGVPTTLDQYTNVTVDLTQMVTANDAVDGEIIILSAMVDDGGLNFNVAGVYTVTYSVYDLSGNITTLEVEVTIVDKQVPVIGIGDFNINKGDAFDGLAGLVVTDNIDGIIPNSSVIITGLDAFVVDGFATSAGTFVVTYQVTDANGNTATKSINVNVSDIVWDESSRTPLGTPDEGPTHSIVTYDDIEGAYVISNIDINVDPWDHARWVYYFTSGAELVFGQTYKFEITVKADVATDLYFRIGSTLWVDPWIDNFNGGLTNFSITSEYVTYQVVFTVDKAMVNGNAKFQFMYGYLPTDATNNIYIKSFDLLQEQQPIIEQVVDLAPNNIVSGTISSSTVTVDAVEDAFVITNIPAYTYDWMVGRITNMFDNTVLQYGETYRIKVVAKATTATDLKVRIGTTLGADPWIDNFEGGVNRFGITTEYVTYYIYFTVDKESFISANSAKMEFDYGFLSDTTNTIYVKEFAIEHVYNPLVAGDDYIVVDGFDYADEAAFEAEWTNRVSGANLVNPPLLNLETLNGGLELTLPETVNNGWFLARNYDSLSSFGLTDEFKHLAFYVNNNTNKTTMSVWLYWSGSQNAFTVNLPAIGESGWVIIDVLATSGFNPSAITDFAIGFDNQTWNVCTGTLTVYEIIALKNPADVSKYAIEIEYNNVITSMDVIDDFEAGIIGSVPFADAASVILALPTSVTANTGLITIPVTGWDDTDTFNPAVAGSYTFTAILGTLPDGIENPSSLTATIEVVVSLEPIVIFNDFEQYVDNADFQAAVDNIVGFRIIGGTPFVKSNGTLMVDGTNQYIIQNVNTSTGTAGIRIKITQAEIPANIQYIAIYVKATDTTNMVKFQSFVYKTDGTYAEVTSSIVSDFTKLAQGTVVYIPVSAITSNTNQLSLVINYNSGVVGQLIWDNVLYVEEFLPNEAPVVSVSDENLAILSGMTFKAGESLEAFIPTLLGMISITDAEDGIIAAAPGMLSLDGLDLANPLMGSYDLVVTATDSGSGVSLAYTIKLSVVQVLNDFESYADDAAFKAGFSFTGFRSGGSAWAPATGSLVTIGEENVLQSAYATGTNGIRINMTKAQLVALGAEYVGIYLKTSAPLSGTISFQAFGYDASFTQQTTYGNIAYTDEGTYVYIAVSSLTDTMTSISLMINISAGNTGTLTYDNIVIK